MERKRDLLIEEENNEDYGTVPRVHVQVCAKILNTITLREYQLHFGYQTFIPEPTARVAARKPGGVANSARLFAPGQMQSDVNSV